MGLTCLLLRPLIIFFKPPIFCSICRKNSYIILFFADIGHDVIFDIYKSNISFIKMDDNNLKDNFFINPKMIQFEIKKML